MQNSWWKNYNLELARACILCFLFLLPAVPVRAGETGKAVPQSAGATLQEVLLAVEINGRPATGAALLLRGRDGLLYASAGDLQNWRLHLPQAAPIHHQGAQYFSLGAVADLGYKLDDATQTVVIQAPAKAFLTTRLLDQPRPVPPPARADRGGFFNYDLLAQRVPGTGQGDYAGLFEAGFFENHAGVGVTNFLLRNADWAKQAVRLDTTWTVDDPERRASLRIADATSRPATMWGRSVRFGGVQYATNFSTQPYLATFPLQSVAGEAVLPSTVDVFVNNTLVSRREMAPGPFAIGNLPTITGQGDMTVVVRDILGREQVVTQPFYSSASVLQQGLEDFSYETGWVRENYGSTSNDYGRWLAAGTYRRGISDRFTAEIHGETMQSDQVTVGLAGAYIVPELGVISAAAAGSHGRPGAGQLASLGFERQSLKGLNYGARAQAASSGFRQIGLLEGEAAPRLLANAAVSYSAGALGSLGLGYILQDYRVRERTEIHSASYSVPLPGRATLTVSVLKSVAAVSSNSVFAVITLPLGDRTSGSVTMQQNTSGGRRMGELSAQAQQSLPAGEGFGWNVRASDRGTGEAGVAYQTDFGTYRLDAARAHGQEIATRANVSGGVAFLGGSAFLGRKISDSFGVVQVPDYPNVRVYADNQLVARTDADGNAFLPRLRAYEKNPVGVAQADLPLDAKVDALTVDAVPYYRSGLLLRFPVKRSYGALIRVVLEDGRPIPAGAVARIAGKADEFPVALEGEAYLTGLAETNQVRITWREQACDITVTMKQSSDPLPHLGSFVCIGVRP